MGAKFFFSFPFVELGLWEGQKLENSSSSYQNSEFVQNYNGKKKSLVEIYIEGGFLILSSFVGHDTVSPSYFKISAVFFISATRHCSNGIMGDGRQEM